MKKSKFITISVTLALCICVLLAVAISASAEPDTDTVNDTPVLTSAPATATAENAAEVEDGEASLKSVKAIVAAAIVGLVATAGAVGMAISICKSAESMARQPEAADKINSAMMLGLVFIETAIIYALIVAILVIFVL